MDLLYNLDTKDDVVYAVARCFSVRLSRSGVVSKRLDVSSKSFAGFFHYDSVECHISRSNPLHDNAACWRNKR